MFSQMYFIDQYTCNNHFKYHFLLTYCQQKLVNKFLQLSFIQCDHVPFELGRRILHIIDVYGDNFE